MTSTLPILRHPLPLAATALAATALAATALATPAPPVVPATGLPCTRPCRSPLLRGPLSRLLVRRLTGGELHLPAALECATVAAPDGPLDDEDLQLALAICYELHYRGFDGVSEGGSGTRRCSGCAPGWSTGTWPPCATAGRPARADRRAGRPAAGRAHRRRRRPVAVRRSWPSRARVEQWREFLTQRSVYHLKEADPHTWAIPRLAGRPRRRWWRSRPTSTAAARPSGCTASCSPDRCATSAWTTRYGALVDRVPGGRRSPSVNTDVAVRAAPPLARRRRRPPRRVRDDLLGAQPPLRRGLRRLGLRRARPRGSSTSTSRPTPSTSRSPVTTCPAAWPPTEPELAADVLFGAAAVIALEAAFARRLIDAWDAGRSSSCRRRTVAPDASLPSLYVLPLRWRDDGGLDELTAYLRWLAARVDDVVVVDGSDPARFAEHARRRGPTVRHLRPHPDLRFASGKVNGVVTGVREAAREHVVVADDDVRYGEDALRRMLGCSPPARSSPPRTTSSRSRGMPCGTPRAA